MIHLIQLLTIFGWYTVEKQLDLFQKVTWFYLRYLFLHTVSYNRFFHQSAQRPHNFPINLSRMCQGCLEGLCIRCHLVFLYLKGLYVTHFIYAFVSCMEVSLRFKFLAPLLCLPTV